MARNVAIVLKEIVSAITLARTAAARSVTPEAFADDLIGRAAVERFIEIVSEPVRHLPDDITDRHPTIPWQQIKAVGNKLRHEYHRIDSRIIWDLVQLDLDALETAINKELLRSAQ
ncbi:MAG: HepT-like ribonuclease domain-containing protein [Hyphomicrobium sp.]